MPVPTSGWELETYVTIRAEVISADMLDYDPDHGVVLVERWFKHNPPMNDKHAMGTARLIAEIELTGSGNGPMKHLPRPTQQGSTDRPKGNPSGMRPE